MKIPKIFKKRKNEINVSSVDDVLLKALFENETITRAEAMQIPAVSKAVDFIAGTIASIPIKLYQEENGNIKEIKDDNRISLLNDDTKDTLDGNQFKRALVEDYLLSKGGYAYICKKRNTVVSLHYVEEKYVQILSSVNNHIFKDYEIVVDGKGYKPFEFIKILRNTKNGATGEGIIPQVSKALETSFQNMLYQLILLKSGGNKRGFIKSENSLSKDAINDLKNAWKKLYANNENNVVVLNKGLDFKEASSSSVEMQLNENRKTLTQEIEDIFHIKSNYNDTFKEAIYPLLSVIECALNRDLLLEKEKKDFFFSFDLKEILKGTLKERFEAYKLAKETGWITLNEIRYLENKDPIEGLDIIAMSLGNVIYDTKAKQYYTPNTDSTKLLGKGGDDSEE